MKMRANSKKLKLRRKKARSKREAKRPHQVSSDEQESNARVKKRRKLRKKRCLVKNKVFSNDDASKKERKHVDAEEDFIDGFSIRCFSTLEDLKSSYGSQINSAVSTPTISTSRNSRIPNSSNESTNETRHTKRSSSKDSISSRSTTGDGYIRESEISEGSDDRESSDSEFFATKLKNTVFPKAKNPAFPTYLPGLSSRKHLQKYPRRLEAVPQPPPLVAAFHSNNTPVRKNIPHDPKHPSISNPPRTRQVTSSTNPYLANNCHNTPTKVSLLSEPRDRATYPKVNAPAMPTNSSNQKICSPPSKSVQLFNPFGSSDQTSTIRDELNRRFLASSKSPDSSQTPNVPAEIHQHQHTHQHTHKHTITAQPYPDQQQYPTNPTYPSRQTIPPQYQQATPFRPSHPLPNLYHGLFNSSLYNQPAAPPFGLVGQDPSGYQGLGLPVCPGPLGSRSHGAFQPRQVAPPPLMKAPPTTSLFKRPSPNKPGRWCATHGVIARLIQQHQRKLGTDPNHRLNLAPRGSSSSQRTAFQAHPHGSSKDNENRIAFGGLGQTSHSEHPDRQKPPSSGRECEEYRRTTHERTHSPNGHRSRSPVSGRNPGDRTRSRSPLQRHAPSMRIPPTLHVPPPPALLHTGHSMAHWPGHYKLPTHPTTSHIGAGPHPLAGYLPDPIHVPQHARMTELCRPPDFMLHGLAAAPSYSRPPVMFAPDLTAAFYHPSFYGSGLYAPQAPMYPGLPPHVAFHYPYRPPNP